MKKIGIQANDIFSPSKMSKPTKILQPQQLLKISEPKPELKQELLKIGRPKILINSVKSTVTFDNAQIVWLDRLSSDIRAKTMAIIDRGAIIRAIISALAISKLDFSNIKSEEELSDFICSHFKTDK